MSSAIFNFNFKVSPVVTLAVAEASAASDSKREKAFALSLLKVIISYYMNKPIDIAKNILCDMADRWKYSSGLTFILFFQKIRRERAHTYFNLYTLQNFRGQDVSPTTIYKIIVLKTFINKLMHIKKSVSDNKTV